MCPLLLWWIIFNCLLHFKVIFIQRKTYNCLLITKTVYEQKMPTHIKFHWTGVRGMRYGIQKFSNTVFHTTVPPLNKTNWMVLPSLNLECHCKCPSGNTASQLYGINLKYLKMLNPNCVLFKNCHNNCSFCIMLNSMICTPLLE